MASGILTLDLDAVTRNWTALSRMGDCEAGAVVKADGYGTGAAEVARALVRAGARSFFVALAHEGAALRQALGAGPAIHVLSGHMAGDAAVLRDHDLIPMLTGPDQVARHFEALPDRAFGVQLDTGMNRLGLKEAEWQALSDKVLAKKPALALMHLACADEPDHPMNARQLAVFHRMTDGLGLRRTAAATGGILLGKAYHFDLTRPGVGLYGAAPFSAGENPVRLSLPIIQVRDVTQDEAVGYSCGWVAPGNHRIATLAAGYADGIFRSLSGKATLWAGDTPCPLVSRVSMDLITVDVTHLPEVPDRLDLIGPHQTADALAAVAGTIGYEILTALGPRYERRYIGGKAGASA